MFFLITLIECIFIEFGIFICNILFFHLILPNDHHGMNIVIIISPDLFSPLRTDGHVKSDNTCMYSLPHLSPLSQPLNNAGHNLNVNTLAFFPLSTTSIFTLNNHGWHHSTLLPLKTPQWHSLLPCLYENAALLSTTFCSTPFPLSIGHITYRSIVS